MTIADAEREAERTALHCARLELTQLKNIHEDQMNAERENVDQLNAQVRILEGSSREFIRSLDETKEEKARLLNEVREWEAGTKLSRRLTVHHASWLMQSPEGALASSHALSTRPGSCTQGQPRGSGDFEGSR